MVTSTTLRAVAIQPAFRRLTLAAAGIALLLAIVGPVGAPPAPAGTTVVLRDPASSLSWSFETCRALGSEHEVVEYPVVDGSGVETILMLPGRLRFLDLECSRPLSRDTSLWEWRKLVEQGAIEEARRNLELDLFDAALRGVDTWTVGAAWPSRLETVLTPGSPTERVRIVMENVVRNGEEPPLPTATPWPTSPPTPPPTATPIPTNTPTPPVPTPTPTPIPPGDEIFKDGFESGDTARWSSTIP